METERLIIRPYGDADFDAYYAYIMDPELQADLGLNGVTDEMSARETFRWLQENTVFLALISKSRQHTIGHIVLHPPYELLTKDPAFQNRTGHSLSLAIAKEERRKGLMYEALRSLIRELFAERSIEFLDAEAEPDNPASNALQEKLGFTLWGRDSFDDVELLIRVLTKEHWQATKKALW